METKIRELLKKYDDRGEKEFAIELLELVKEKAYFEGSENYEAAQMEVGKISVEIIDKALEELRK